MMQAQLCPAPPELRVEIEHFGIRSTRVFFQPESLRYASQDHIIYLAQRIILERTLRYPPGLFETPHRKQVEVGLPLADVPGDGFAGYRDAKPALRFFPIQLVRPSHNPQHAMRFRQV